MLGTNFNKPIYIIFITLVLICIVLSTKAQNPSGNSEKNIKLNPEEQVHSPHKATMYSAVVPGLGQIYNKKYWKLPIIYGVAGVFIYAFDVNNNQYNKYKNAYAEFDTGKITEFEGYTNKDIILRLKDYHLRNRDLNVIVLAGVYMLNIIDATVDAHLFDYDISEDLSLNIQPSMMRNINQQNALGLTCRLSF
ncbi:MAG: hypothetical protein PWP52_2224 [Bacteroidales bacterium]|nr:hypothetical protein [Bacteroidales bacterium]